MPDNVNFRMQIGQSCYTCRHRQLSKRLEYTCEAGDGEALRKLSRYSNENWAHMVTCDNWQEALHEQVGWWRQYIEDRIGTEDGDE